MLQLFEFFCLSIFGFVLGYQVLAPLWQGRPVFPFFRKTGELRHEIVNLQGDLENAELKAEAKRIVAELKGKKNAR